jgi:hypothetical protein
MKLTLLLVAGIVTAADLQTLRTSRDSKQLLDAAIAIVNSRDNLAIAQLADLLATREFLERLDDLTIPSKKTFYVNRLFDAIEKAPSRATEHLCLKLASAPDFVADPVRLNYLLPALGAVIPMSDVSAALFRRTNAEGYVIVNAPVLAGNGSPAALRVFEEMMSDPRFDVDERIDAAHHSIVPNRTHLPLLQSIDRLLGQKIDPEVHAAVLESVFDYQPRAWFGVARNPPSPPDWQSASPETRKFVEELRRRYKGRQTRPSNRGKQILH